MTMDPAKATDPKVSALLDFLEDYYRRNNPPVRSVEKYGEFLIRQDQVAGMPGVTIHPSADKWLTSVLVEHGLRPEVPKNFARWVNDRTLSPKVKPTVSLNDDAADEEVEAALLLEEWADNTWSPWAAEWKRIEAGRDFYKKLYSLRARLEGNRDSLELVWGFGRLRWSTSKGQIDHPLITVRAELELDDDGQLALVPVEAPEIEVACIAEVDLADRPAYQGLRRTGAADDINLWLNDSRTDVYRRLLRLLDHDGAIRGPGASTASNAASLEDEWVIFIRRRQTEYLDFLNQQRLLYRGGTEPSAPFLALVADHPSNLADSCGSPTSKKPSPPQDGIFYLPKPTNEEQRRIVRLAQHRVGVTAQGPPGTGKSHTIANLLSHFVAQGKRVLVTAEKEQALSVLAEKLPPAVRELTVAVLGTDQSSRTRLEQAVNFIQERVAEYDQLFVESEIKHLESQVASIDSKIASESQKLRAVRTSETTRIKGNFEAGPDPSPGEIARWLRANEGSLSFIPDQLAAGSLMPLDEAQWRDLLALIEQLDPSDIDACARPRPDAQRLSSGAELDRISQELKGLRSLLAGVESLITSWDAIDAVGTDSLSRVVEQLESAERWRRENEGTWVDRIRVECSTPFTREEWREFVGLVTSYREGAITQRRVAAAFDVTVPDDPDAAFESGLQAARARLAAGHGISRIFQRAASKAVALCRVNGKIPATTEQIDVCLSVLARRKHQRLLKTIWANGIGRVKGPSLDEEHPPEDAIVNDLDQIVRAMAWPAETWPLIADELRRLGILAVDNPTCDQLAALVSTVDKVSMRAQERRLTKELDTTDQMLRAGSRPTASPLWKELAEAKTGCYWIRWDAARNEVMRLASLEASVEKHKKLLGILAQVAPDFATFVSRSRAAPAPDYRTVIRAWEWRRLETLISTFTLGPSSGTLQRHIEELALRRLRCLEELVAARAWQGLVTGFNDRKRSALNKYLTAMKRFGKTGGKYAARWLREMREALDDSKDAIPAWIMPTSRVLSSFRPESTPPFDVLIVDEASQIGLLALPILSLARKAIVVGDDQQTSPENVGLDRQSVFELIEIHLRPVNDSRTLFDPDNSLYDVSRQKFPEVVVLREHFRSLPAIISFSNRRYYDDRMIPLRDRLPVPGWNPVGTVFVPDGFRDGRDINEPEAQATVDLITDLCNDAVYSGMTFGVVTLLGGAQSLRIQNLLLDRLGPDVLEERDIRCGEAPDFQGDERDVIIISMVVDKPEGGRIHAMTDRRSERRLNVAASRAKNQLWVVHSIKPEDLPSGDPRADLIRHCENPGAIESALTGLETRCESQFEKDVLRKILERGYLMVRTQHEVGHYRIDIVVEGPDGRLAVECDGDAWHGPEKWDADRTRQQILERAGWTFERIRASAFYRHPDQALDSLWARLVELEVPTGDWSGSLEPRASRRIARTMAERLASTTDLATQTTPDEESPSPHEPADIEERRGHTSTARDSLSEPDSIQPVMTGSSRPPTNDTLTTSDPLADAPPIALQPYRQWPTRQVGAILSGNLENVGAEMLEIVEWEGPIQAQRIYQLHARAAGGQRVGREMRQAYNRLLNHLVKSGRLALLDDLIQGPTERIPFTERTVFIPGSPKVVARELGPRQLAEVPISEIAALIADIRVARPQLPDPRRAILNAYGLVRLTPKVMAYLDRCFEYHARATRPSIEDESRD